MITFRTLLILVWLVLAGAVVLIAPVAAAPLAAPAACVQIGSEIEMGAPTYIHFDNLPHNTIIGDSYRPSHGVRFEVSAAQRAVTDSSEPAAEVVTAPNVAVNRPVAPNTSNNAAMTITFDEAKRGVSMRVGNGERLGPTAVLTGYDAGAT